MVSCCIHRPWDDLREVKNELGEMDEISRKACKYRPLGRCFAGHGDGNWPSWDDLKSKFRPRLPSLGRFGKGEKRGWKHVDGQNGFWLLASPIRRLAQVRALRAVCPAPLRV